MSDPDEFLLYLRKSNGRKAVPRQRAITSAYVVKLGGRVGAEFSDADSTAFRKIDGEQPKRDGFASMLAVLRSRPGLKVAAWHADRLTRNPEDTEELIRVCASGGHLVETPTGGSYDLSTANGRKRFRDDANDAAYEVDHGRERVLAARAEVAADGRWLGGKRPFGWELDRNPVDEQGPMLDDDGNPVKGILNLVQVEADALARAHQTILSGGTIAGIAREWNTKGILTPSGKPWRAKEVGRVLRRPRNAALMEYQGNITGPARWPAVVEEPTWRAVMAILSDPARATTPGPGRRHLLTWLARCGVEGCGGPLICTSTSRAVAKGRERRLVYRCRENSTPHVARDAASLDDFVVQLVIGRLSRADAADLLVKDRRDELAALHHKAASIRELMAADRRLHLAGLLTEIEFASGRKQHQADLNVVIRQLGDLVEVDVLAPLIGDPAAAWGRLPLDRKRAVVDALMKIRVMSAPKGRPAGWRPGQGYFDGRSIEITWRQGLP